MTMFLVPGKTLTSGFFTSWSKLMAAMFGAGRPFSLVNYYSADIYGCRNALLAPDVDGPYAPGAPPFNGKRDYQHVFWLDSDTVFEPAHVFKLLDSGKDVISGVVPIDDERAALAVIGDDYRPRYFNYKRLDEIPCEGDLARVDFAGGAFLCVRRGVYEALGYPWYSTVDKQLPNGRRQWLSEDFGVCERIRAAGFSIWADLTVKVGHEKAWVLKA